MPFAPPPTPTDDVDADRLEGYDYPLPPEAIATQPAEQRDQARLLVTGPGGEVEHRRICDLPSLLRSGDRLVFNRTHVAAARLEGVRIRTGGRWAGLVLEYSNAEGLALAKTRGTPKRGELIELQNGTATATVRLRSRREDGRWEIEPETGGFSDMLRRVGLPPLPPYILKARRDRGEPLGREDDATRYQTVFADASGETSPASIAAPTAGLHFTAALLDDLQSVGVGCSFVSLAVGEGTFRPVEVQHLDEHRMHEEWACLPDETATELNATQAAGGRVIAVGTTTLRTLEAAAHHGRDGWTGRTNLFIRPGYTFRRADGLLTNFHLPKSTLLMLVAAMLGRRRMLSTYDAALRAGYRFFSYGDAMLILPSDQAATPAAGKSDH